MDKGQLIRRYPMPTRLKARPARLWLEKAIYWHSAVVENTGWFAHEYLKYSQVPGYAGYDTPAHTVRRTSRMLRIIELCLTGLAHGRIGASLAVDRRRCEPPARRRHDVH